VEHLSHRRGLTGFIYLNYLLNKKRSNFNHHIGLGITIPYFMRFRMAFISRYTGQPMWENVGEYGFILPFISLTEKISITKKWKINLGGRLILLPPGSYYYSYSQLIDPGPIRKEIVNLASDSGERFFYPEFNLSIAKSNNFKKANLEWFLGYNYSLFHHLKGSITYTAIDEKKYNSPYAIKNSGISLGVEVRLN
jgi:hypothetical protein